MGNGSPCVALTFESTEVRRRFRLVYVYYGGVFLDVPGWPCAPSAPILATLRPAGRSGRVTWVRWTGPVGQCLLASTLLLLLLPWPCRFSSSSSIIINETRAYARSAVWASRGLFTGFLAAPRRQVRRRRCCCGVRSKRPPAKMAPAVAG